MAIYSMERVEEYEDLVEFGERSEDVIPILPEKVQEEIEKRFNVFRTLEN